MIKPEQLIKNQFQRLPEPLQKALESVPWKSTVKEIAISNQIPLEKIELVEKETLFILYGFDEPANYISNLMQEVGITEDVATAIAKSVNANIFKVISDRLEAEEKKATTPPSKTIPPPIPKPALPEVAPEIHPVIEKNEVVHSVAPKKEVPVEPKPVVEVKTEKAPPVAPTPDYRYPGGKDPYREPIQ